MGEIFYKLFFILPHFVIKKQTKNTINNILPLPIFD